MPEHKSSRDAEILRAVYRAIDWPKLYESAPAISREEVDALFRRLAGPAGAAATAGTATPAARTPAARAAKPAGAPAGPVERLIIHTDGASKGNPGPSGIGVVLSTPDGSVVAEIGRYVGRVTNNQAEYLALEAGLERAAELGARAVSIRSDSELMVRQLEGVYRVKNPKLQPLFDRVVARLKSFRSHDVAHVPREENARADALASKAAREDG